MSEETAEEKVEEVVEAKEETAEAQQPTPAPQPMAEAKPDLTPAPERPTSVAEQAKTDQLTEEEQFEKAMTSGSTEEKKEEVLEKTNFEIFNFNKQFKFQDMTNIYIVTFEDGSTEEVKEDSVHNIIDKFKDKEIKSITAKTSMITSIFEGSCLESSNAESESAEGDSEEEKKEASE